LFDLVQETQSEQFSSVRWVFGRPVLSSSFTSSRPSLNLLCQSKTLDFFIASAPLQFHLCFCLTLHRTWC
jgi:hypothetical protein